MGSFCSSPTTVTQQQTYNPNPYAAGAISGALSQGQSVAQTPFQTPVAPVAGFSPQQQQAFNITGQAQGQAQPYLDQAQQYFSGANVNQFLNPFASNVMAGLKDVFGEQQQQTTGNLQQQAGGVGADRIAVGQADLAKQQGLAAGQTLAGLYQPALAASQNAGFGIGALGPVAQNASLQGAQALLGTGGLQQQLQQAQLNAPYQQQLAQIQWPYQNAQFNANITGALAPGLGGTTSGQTTYPQQSPWGTIAGLGLAGLGGYGAAGGFTGLSNLNQGYNYDGSMSGSQWAAAGQGQGPYASARGGRINPYASGGTVDLDRNEDGSYGYAGGGDVGNDIQSAEIKELQDEGNPAAAGIHSPSMPGARPINVAAQSLIPTGQIAQIQPHIPQLPQPSQSGSGSSFMGTLGNVVGAAAKFLPLMGLNSGGRVGYADGGAPGNPFDPTGWGRPDPVPAGEGFWPGYLRQAAALAPLGLRAGAMRLIPTNTASPQLRVRGPISSHDAWGAGPRWNHPAVRNSPVPGGLAASTLLDHGPSPAPMRHFDAGSEGKGFENDTPPPGDSFADRFGGIAPPSAGGGEPPLFLQSGMAQHQESDFVPPSAYGHEPTADDHVPIPRSNPFVGPALAHEAKKRAELAPSKVREPFYMQYQTPHMAEGGEVDDAPNEPLWFQSGMQETPPSRSNFSSLMDPFERAAHRQREAVQPGRFMPGPPDVHTPGEMAEAALMLAGPPALRAVSAVPKLATAALAGYYGLSGTDQAGGAESADEVKKLQTDLKQKGYYAGTIDGNMGPATKAAKDAFDKAEQARLTNEREQARILTDQKAAEASTAGANAQTELAKAQLAQIENERIDKERKAQQRDAGAKRLREMESNLSPIERAVRDYATPIGFTMGAVGGKLLQGTVSKAYSSLMAKRAANAENLFSTTAADTPSRVAKVNEFWRKGGSSEVPFTNTPGAKPGFSANPNAAAMDRLYRPPTAINAATDAAGVGMFGAESAAAQHWMVGPREEELRLANEAVSNDPNEVNINRLQDAKNKLAVAEALKTFGRVGALGYLGGSAIKGRVHTAPNMEKAEAEKLALEGLLRKASPAKKAVEAVRKPGAGFIGIPPASTGVAATKARQLQAAGGRVSANSYEAYGTDSADDWGDIAVRQNLAESFPDTLDMRRGNWEESNGGYKPAGMSDPHIEDAPAAPEEARTQAVNPYRAAESVAKSDSPEVLANTVRRAPAQAKSLIDNPWMALVQAGLGTMAAAGQRDARGLPTSPLAAIGQGGMKGIEELQKQQAAGMKQQSIEQAAGMKQQSIEQAAKRLDQQAKFHQEQFKANENYRKERLSQQEKAINARQEQSKFFKTGSFDPNTGEEILLFKDPATGAVRRVTPSQIPGFGQQPPSGGNEPARAIPVSEQGQPPATPIQTQQQAPYEPPLATTSIAPVGGRIINDEPQTMVQTEDATKLARSNPDVMRAYNTPAARKTAMGAAVAEGKTMEKSVAAANNSLGRTYAIRNDINVIENYLKTHQDDRLAKALLTPGIAGDARSNLLNAWATTSKNAPQDVIAAVNDWKKQALLQGFSNIIEQGMSAREAMPIIQAAQSATPQFGVTLESSKRILAGLEQGSERQRHAKAFFDAYKTKNGGISEGWREAFDNVNPPEKYTARAYYSTLSPDKRRELPDSVKQLRDLRDGVIKAEQSGDAKAAELERNKYMHATQVFDSHYGGLANYFSFGRI